MTLASIVGWLSQNIAPFLREKVLFAVGVGLTVEIARYIGLERLVLKWN